MSASVYVSPARYAVEARRLSRRDRCSTRSGGSAARTRPGARTARAGPGSATARPGRRSAGSAPSRAGRAGAQVPLTEGALVPTTEVTLGLAECELARGAAADAVKRAEARLAWLEAQAAEPGALARVQWVVARALVAAGGAAGDRARARQLAEAARTGYATLGAPGKARAAEIARWLAARR